MTPTIRSLVATLAGLLLGALPGAPVTAQHFPPDEDVVPMLRYLVEDGATVGIVLALRDSDGSTRILTYGSGGEGARALGAESVFEIGSITKTFTGVLLADMVMRGEVSLRDPVSRYLPAHVRMPSWRGHEITLLDLATHRSGLPRMPDNGDPPIQVTGLLGTESRTSTSSCQTTSCVMLRAKKRSIRTWVSDSWATCWNGLPGRAMRIWWRSGS